MIKIEIEVKCPYCDSNDIVRNVNHELLKKSNEKGVDIDIVPINTLDIKLDEISSFVGEKSSQRWVWLATDHKTGETVAFVFG